MKKISIKNLLVLVWGMSIVLIAMPAMATSYTITASSDANSAISPSGAVSVTSGANQTFIVTPNTGNDVSSITIDYTNQPTPIPTTTANVFQYTFRNVTAAHTISVSSWPSALAQGAPQITSQPQSVSMLPGTAATFTVAATQSSAINGSSVPSYQWYKSTNGGTTFTSISGANTPSYTTPVTTSSDNGTEFVCEVFNGYAFVSTNMVTLTMFPYVKVQGRQLQVWNFTAGQYQPYVIRGVGYNPTPIGRYSSDWGYYASAANPNPSNLDPNIYDDTNILNRDFTLLQAMNANTIRIWGGDNSIETASNQPVSALTFENAFPLQALTYGSNIYAWLVQNNYLTGAGYVNVSYLTTTSYLNTLQQEFTDSNEGIVNGEYYTILDVLRKAYYGDANPARFPNMITATTLSTAGSYGLKVIAGFYVPAFGSCNKATTPCTYTLNTYSGESNDSGLKVLFDITNPYIRNDILLRFEMYVNTFKNNPNILFWAIGNENNLSFDPNNPDSHFNTTAQIQGWYSLVNQMAAAAHAIEGVNYHPVAVVNGDDGFTTIGNSTDEADDTSLSNVDIWGINTYRGQSFYNYFLQYKSLSTKPLWVSEYGIDAWQSCTADSPAIAGCDSNDPSAPAAAYAPASPYQPANDEADQASWDGGLWNEIAGNGDISIGATVMAYSDNWWQPYDWICNNYPYNTYGNAAFCQSNHFYFGEGPGSAWSNTSSLSSPDHYFNEAWFGLMGISNTSPQTQPDTMHPRQAYTTLQGEFASNVAIPSYLASPVQGTSLSTSSVTFAWSLGRGVTQYQLLVGTTQGGSDIYSNNTLTSTSVTVTGIPLTGGTIYVQLASYINGAWQQAVSYTFATTALSPINQWKALNFTAAQLANPNISGNTASPAGDGIPNLFKYAFNLNPFTVYSHAFQYSLLNNYFTIVYRQNLKATDLTYQIGATNSLVGPWVYNSFASVTQPIDVNTQLVTATDSVNSTTVSARFFKFVLTLQGGQSMMASIAASPSNTYFSVTATAGTGGTISPSGVTNVLSQGSQSFTITPNTGYVISSVVDNSVDVTTQLVSNAYTLNTVNMAHTITASFTPITFAVTASAGTGGTITPSGTMSVNDGTNQSFTITPNTGYVISSVLDNSVDVTAQLAGNAYTLNAVNMAHTIAATFTPITYVVTASAGTGGSITPSGSETVNYGTSQSFTITPSTGYAILSVMDNNVNVTAQLVGNAYTLNTVNMAHTITATFIQAYTITTSIGGSGSGIITYTCGSSASACASPVDTGTKVNFTATPAIGSSFVSWLGACASSQASKTCTINIASNTSVIANFKDIMPPTVPGNLTANPTITTGNVTQLTWSASTDNIGVAGYTVVHNGMYVANTTNISWTGKNLRLGANTYQVFAYDKAGNRSALSKPVQVTRATLPVIKQQPVSKVVSIITLRRGYAGSFSVMATATPSPTYQWYASQVDANNSILILVSGATKPIYVFSIPANAKRSTNFSMSFMCKITNAAGWVNTKVVTLKAQ